MKILFLVLLFSSCNVIETLTDGETKLDEEFFQREIGTDSLYSELVDFWRFDEGGGVQRNSITNNRNFSENVALNSVPGIRGNAVDCSSANATDYNLVNLTPGTLITGGKYSFSFWINITSLSATIEVLTLENTNPFKISFEPLSGSGAIEMRVYSGGTFSDFIDVISTAGSFQHIVLTMDGATLKLYRNGVFEASISYLSSNTAFTRWTACSDQAGTSNGFQLDSLGFWHRILSLDEIGKLYNHNNNLE